jgi:chromosome segregation ATPase
MEELEKTQSDLIAAKTEHDEMAAKLASVESGVTESAAKLAETEAAKITAVAALEKLQAEMTQAVSDRDAQIKTLTESLNDAKAKLANPAFQLSAGDSRSIAEGGQSVEKMSAEQALTEYNKIENPVAAAKFRAEHRAELGLK